MAELTEARRDKLKKSQFGMPGSRKYPMPDKGARGERQGARHAAARKGQHLEIDQGQDIRQG